MTLKTQLLQDLTVFFNLDEFSENIVYSTGAKTVKALVNQLGFPDIAESHSQAHAEIFLKIGDVPTLDVMDEFYFYGNTWTVERILAANPEVIQILVRKKEGVKFD